MPIKRVIETSNASVNVFTDDICENSVQQLANTAALPIVCGDMAAMPDVHYGIGATVGSVIPTFAAIIPAAVGVDIGCGMIAQQLSITAKDLPDSLAYIRSALEKVIPVGFSMHDDRRTFNTGDLFNSYHSIIERHPKLLSKRKSTDFVYKQLGTLGGGNHFVELCLDENDSCWLMLHSGSRGIGSCIGNYFIDKAKESMAKNHPEFSLPDINLAWLDEGNLDFRDYMEALHFAQRYAAINREKMMLEAMNCFYHFFHKITMFQVLNLESAINCHHNYVFEAFDDSIYITRKGAISASKDQLGIIPGSMGTKSYIVRGLGNPDSLYSCSHGAGRRMSRKQAKEKFTIEDLKEQTKGVECKKNKSVIDEIPGAYKDIDEVMKNQEDLVEVVHTLKQVLCIKG